jgi:hypothetical protein
MAIKSDASEGRPVMHSEGAFVLGRPTPLDQTEAADHGQRCGRPQGRLDHSA